MPPSTPQRLAAASPPGTPSTFDRAASRAVAAAHEKAAAAGVVEDEANEPAMSDGFLSDFRSIAEADKREKEEQRAKLVRRQHAEATMKAASESRSHSLHAGGRSQRRAATPANVLRPQSVAAPHAARRPHVTPDDPRGAEGKFNIDAAHFYFAREQVSSATAARSRCRERRCCGDSAMASCSRL